MRRHSVPRTGGKAGAVAWYAWPMRRGSNGLSSGFFFLLKKLRNPIFAVLTRDDGARWVRCPVNRRLLTWTAAAGGSQSDERRTPAIQRVSLNSTAGRTGRSDWSGRREGGLGVRRRKRKSEVSCRRAPEQRRIGEVARFLKSELQITLTDAVAWELGRLVTAQQSKHR